MATYHTIAEPLHVPASTINGSRFIADIFPAASAAEALAHVETVQHRHPDASHHCWAYRLYEQNQARSSDDGEPGGSAGRPILAQIEGHELFDIVVIVTRYFGGTKLGVGGLIRAYGGTAGKALDRVQRLEIRETQPLEIEFAYDLTKAVDTALREANLRAKNTVFEERVRMSLDVPVESYAHLCESLTQQTAGQVRFLSGSQEPDGCGL